MFEKILLPLDGSELAEAALPYVRDLASQLEADVFLLHACPTEHKIYLHMHQIYVQAIAENLRREMQKNWHRREEPSVQAEVIVGEPALVIFDYVKQNSINLVVLTTHGTSGLTPWKIGSIADKVVRGVGIPSLLVRIKETPINPSRNEPIRRILLPLDNSAASQISVPYAVELAKKLRASITLFSMAVSAYANNFGGIGGGIGVNMDSIDASTQAITSSYLQNIAEEIKAAGVEVHYSSHLGMDAAYEILEIEKKSQADLVIMATRGRSSVARWAFGSVAEKVLREGDKPLLLVREKL